LMPGTTGNRRTQPGIRPRPWCRPCSSLESMSICIPRQMPRSGTSFTAAQTVSLRGPSWSMPSWKAPTPGSTMPSAAAISSASPVMTALAPAASIPRITLRRFPRPLSMMVIVVPMYGLPDPPCPALDPISGEILRSAPCFEVFLPPVPEAGKIGLDHVDQCHITGRAHETSDPIQPVFVKPVVGRMFHKKVEPDVKRSPVLDRGGGKLHLYRRVSPHTIALCPREGFVPALADKREALPPGRADRLCDRQELADAAAPAGVDG